MVIDPSTHTTLSLNFGYVATRTATPDGSVASVAVPLGTVTGLRVYLVVDDCTTAWIGPLVRSGCPPNPPRRSPVACYALAACRT